MEHLIPKDYYSKTLVASQADQRVLRDLLAEKLPRLNAHFEALKYGIHTCSSYSLFQLTFRVRGSRKIFRGQKTWVFPNFLTQQLSVLGQGASFLGFLTRDPLLIWNTAY